MMEEGGHPAEKKSPREKKEKKKEKKGKKKDKKHKKDKDPTFTRYKEGLAHCWATRYREADECFAPFKDEDCTAASLYAQNAWVQVKYSYLFVL